MAKTRQQITHDYYKHHKSEIHARRRAHYAAHRNELRPVANEKHRKYLKRIRHETIMAYGGYQCACECKCPVTTSEFLGMDHINGGGNQHRLSAKTSNIYGILRRAGCPSGYRVLCHNCNLAKGFYGHCPFEPVVDEVSDHVSVV